MWVNTGFEGHLLQMEHGEGEGDILLNKGKLTTDGKGAWPTTTLLKR